MSPFWTGATLGFAVGVQLANTAYWLIFQRLRKRFNAELDVVRAEHARIERAVLGARHGGEGLPPELRQ